MIIKTPALKQIDHVIVNEKENLSNNELCRSGLPLGKIEGKQNERKIPKLC